MTHCRECNSEIAEAEAFCPYCGISIKPQGAIDFDAAGDSAEDQSDAGDSLESPEADSDMSETIVTGPGGVFAPSSKEDEVDKDDTDENDAGFVDISELKSETKDQEPDVAESARDESSDSGGGEREAAEVFGAGDVLDEVSTDETGIDADDEEIDLAVSVIDQKAEAKETVDDAVVVEPDEDSIETADESLEATLTTDHIEPEDTAETEAEETAVEVQPEAESVADESLEPTSTTDQVEPEDTVETEAEETAVEVQPEAESVADESLEPTSTTDQVEPEDTVETEAEETAVEVQPEAESVADESLEPTSTTDQVEPEDTAETAVEVQPEAESVADESLEPTSTTDQIEPEDTAETAVEVQPEAESVADESLEPTSTTDQVEPEDKAETEAEETAVEVQPEAESVADEPVIPVSESPVLEDEPVIDDADMEATLIAGSFDLESKTEPETAAASTEDDAAAKAEARESASDTSDMEFRKEPEAGVSPKSDDPSAGEEPVEFLDADVIETEAAEGNLQEIAGEAPVASGEEPPGTTPNIGVGDTDGSKTPKLRPLDEGTVLNERYEIVRKIGGGGMGAVYLASDKNLGGVLRAVKEMVQSYIEKEQQEKAVQDFKRESMLLTSLEHSAIPTIYDYFYDELEARFYLVMKYISGGDLAARLRSAPEGRLDEISVTQWAVEIADVLAYLHDRQPPIVYRDLKPANIMIDGNSSKIMLIDFGIARWVNKEEKGVTAVGTMGYAPPELFSGNVVPSSDIYSLGSTMFHLLTGADPQNNPLLIFDFQKHPRPRQINPNLSDQMERILMRSVEYNSESRFVSAAEMRGELERHLQSLKTGQVSYGIKETPAAVALSDQPVFCGFCGQKIVATDMFCAFCGAKQPLAQPGVQSQEYVLPQTTARLVVEGTGDLSVPTFDLGKKENLVGRRDPMSNIFPEVDLSKYDPQTKISRKHARIWRDGEIYMLEDLGSSNGTMVIQSNNDTTRLAPHQSRALNHGDKIQVGDTTLAFVLG